MAALSDVSEKLVLDWLMTTGSATRPTAWYVALYTGAPSDSGGGTEVSTGGYARQTVTFADIVLAIKDMYPDVYKEVIERSKRLCSVLD